MQCAFRHSSFVVVVVRFDRVWSQGLSMVSVGGKCIFDVLESVGLTEKCMEMRRL